MELSWTHQTCPSSYTSRPRSALVKARPVANISRPYQFSLRSAVGVVYNKGRSLSSPRRDAMFSLLLLGLAFEPPSKVDWPALVQKPNARVAVQDLGLRPLL